MTTLLPPGTDAAAVAAAHAGSPTAVIPGADDRAATFDAFAATLAFPSWFGRNLDALLDCLRQLPDDQVLVWHGSRLAADDRAAYRGVLAVLGQWSAERPTRRALVIR